MTHELTTHPGDVIVPRIAANRRRFKFLLYLEAELTILRLARDLALYSNDARGCINRRSGPVRHWRRLPSEDKLPGEELCHS